MIYRSLTYCTLPLLFYFTLIDSGWGQDSKLPPCANVSTVAKNNCFGAWNGSGGYTYFGEWQNGKQNGLGTATFADGEQYRGEFKQGMRNGKGTDIFPNEDKFVGDFKDDKANGHGTYTFGDPPVQR